MYQKNPVLEFSLFHKQKPELPVAVNNPIEAYKKLSLQRDFMESREIEERLAKCPLTSHLVDEFQKELATVRWNPPMRAEVFLKYQRMLHREGPMYPTNLYRRLNGIPEGSMLTGKGGKF